MAEDSLGKTASSEAGKAADQVEDLLRAREEELAERVKELNCLYSLARLNIEQDLKPDELMLAIVELLPPAFQYPERARASVDFNGSEFHTPGWEEVREVLRQSVIVDGKRVGRLAVGYVPGEGGAGAFLPEERKLLEMVAERVGRIMERRQAQEELVRSRARVNLVLEAVADGYWDLDLATGKEYNSPGWTSLLGYDEGEVEASREGWMALVHPEDKPGLLAAEIAYLTGESDAYQAEYRLRTKSGEWLWVQSRGRVVERGPDREALRVLGIHRDVTEAKAAEERARQQAFAQEVIYELAGKIGYTLNYEEVVILMLAMLHRALSFDAAAGCFEKDGSFEFILRASASLDEKAKDQMVEAIRGYMAEEGGVEVDTKAAQVRTMFMSPERYRSEKLEGLASIMLVPVMMNGRDMIGAMLVGSEEENAFTGEQREMLAAVVAQACLSVDNLHALLEEEEEEHRQLFRVLPMGVLLLDADNVVVLANDLGREYLSLFGTPDTGAALASLGEMPLADILPPLGGGVRRTSMRLPGSSPRYFEIMAQPLEAGLRTGGHVVALEETTDRHQAQEALAASERKFRTLFDHAGDAIFLVSLDGGILDVNKVACERLGYTRDELLGMALTDIYEPAKGKEALGRLQAIRRRGSMSYEAEHLRRDGSLVPVEINSRLIRHEHWLAILAVARDVTARKKAEQAAGEQRGMLAAILDGIEAAFFVVDERGVVKDANERARLLTGRDMGRLVGKPCSQALSLDEHHPEAARVFDDSQEVILDQEAVMVRADGQAVPVSVNKIPVVLHARPHSILVCFDISPRKAMERRLNLAQKMESIGQLAAGIAHEINTPIQFIANNLHFLGEACGQVQPLLASLDKDEGKGDLDYLIEEIPQTLKDSLEGVDRITTIVMAMKKFSHSMTDEKKMLDLNEIVRNTVIVARNEWKYCSVVDLDLDENLPEVPLIPGDMDQVVLNLLTNAAHAVAEKVAGTQDMGRIVLSTRQAQGFAELSVADTGAGIPEANRDKVFNPFFTTKEVGKGTGQGLAIVHAIVADRHGGEVDFISTKGEGTVFIVRLPMGKV